MRSHVFATLDSRLPLFTLPNLFECVQHCGLSLALIDSQVEQHVMGAMTVRMVSEMPLEGDSTFFREALLEQIQKKTCVRDRGRAAQGTKSIAVERREEGDRKVARQVGFCRPQHPCMGLCLSSTHQATIQGSFSLAFRDAALWSWQLRS